MIIWSLKMQSISLITAWRSTIEMVIYCIHKPSMELEAICLEGKLNVSGIYNKNSNLPTGSYLYVFKYFNPYEQQQYTLKGFLTINSN